MTKNNRKYHNVRIEREIATKVRKLKWPDFMARDLQNRVNALLVLAIDQSNEIKKARQEGRPIVYRYVKAFDDTGTVF